MIARIAADTAPREILRYRMPWPLFDEAQRRLIAWVLSIGVQAGSNPWQGPDPDRLVNHLRRAGLL